MGKDYRFNEYHVRETSLSYVVYTYLRNKEMNFPLHPAAEYCNVEGEHYLANDLYEYAEAIIQIISALPEYNRDTPQEVDCWGDPIEDTLSDADKVSSRGLRSYSPEMKAWIKEQAWYMPAVLNSVVTNMTILRDCCQSDGLDSIVLLD